MGLACETGMRTEVEDKCKSTTKSTDTTPTDMHDLSCSVQLTRPHKRTPAPRRRSCTSRSGAWWEQLNQQKKKCVVPARIIIWCWLPIFVSFILDNSLLFSIFQNGCEYINMYYWWCVVVQSTRMRIFLYTRCLKFFFLFCSYWGLIGTVVPLCFCFQ